MSIFDNIFKEDTEQKVSTIQKNNVLFAVLSGEKLESPKVNYPYLPRTKTGAEYIYVTRHNAKIHVYETINDATNNLKKFNPDFSRTANYDELFISVLPTDFSISGDTYYFRSINSDNAVILTCQTKEQSESEKYWDAATDEYSKKSPTLIYKLLDLFLHLGPVTLLQVVKDPVFKEMVTQVKQTTEPNAPELDFLRKKISQIDPSFDENH